MKFTKTFIFIFAVHILSSVPVYCCYNDTNCNDEQPSDFLESYNNRLSYDETRSGTEKYVFAQAVDIPAQPSENVKEANPVKSTVEPAVEEETSENIPAIDTDAPEINTIEQEIILNKKKQPGGTGVPPSSEIKKADKKKPKVEFSGFRYLKFRLFKTSGDESSYSKFGLTNSRGKFEQGTSLTVKAEVGKGILEGTFTEMPLQDRQMKMHLTQGSLGFTYGGFTASVPGGDFASFSKSIDGIQVEYDNDVHSAIFVTSKSKSQTKTRSFSGRNIKGPYDLNARDLVPDNLIVRLNNEILTPDQYILEAFLGQITFFEILGPDDIIYVTFDQNLTGSLNEGTLSAMSYKYAAKNGKLTMGVTLLQKDAFSSDQAVDSIQNEAIVDTASSSVTIKSAVEKVYFLVVRRDETNGSEIITRGGQTLESGKDYNVIPPGNTINSKKARAAVLYGYAHGIFYLATPLATNETVKISYSYYKDDVISCYNKESAPDISIDLTRNTGRLGTDGKKIYYGSETIYRCSTVDSCDITPLEREVDYTYNSVDNEIVFEPAILSIQTDALYRFEGCTYPDVSVLSSAYDHKVSDINIKYKPNKKYEFSYESAQSEADISTKSISILNKTIREAQLTELDCTRVGSLNEACTIPLSRGNIVSGSFVLYLNDRVSDSSVINPYDNYILDTLNGTVKLTMVIPVGTPVIADFQYNPPFRQDPETGNVSKIKARYSSPLTNFAVEMKIGDTKFTSIGGESNLETNRTTFSIDQKFSDKLNVGFNMLTSENAMDIDENNSLKNDQYSYNITYKPKFLTSLQYRVDKNNRSDDFNPRRTDTSETKNSISTGIDLPFLKNASASLSMSTSDTTDNTGTGNSRSTDNKSVGFKYSPSKRLSIDTKFVVNAITMNSQQTSFVSTNSSRNINAKWTPNALLTVNADLDTQLRTDSRGTTEGSEVNNSKFSISSAPFGKVKNISYSYSSQDRPSVSGPSSGSSSNVLTFGYKLTNSISVSPRLSFTSASAGGNSNTDTTSRSWLFEYLPAEKPYRADFNLDNSETTSTRTGGTSTSASSRWSSTISYTPSVVWNYSFKLEGDNQTTDSGPNGYSSFIYSTRIKRTPSTTVNQWLTYQKTSRGGSVSQSDAVLEIGSSHQLNKMISFDVSFKRTSLENKFNSASNYSAYLLESMLKATF